MIPSRIKEKKGIERTEYLLDLYPPQTPFVKELKQCAYIFRTSI